MHASRSASSRWVSSSTFSADTAHADLLGARLVAIDGRAIREVRATAHTLWGGTPAWRDRHVPFFLESPDQMLEAGVTSRPDAATYRFQLPDGRTVDRHVVADPPDARREAFATSRWLIPEPLDTDRGTWRFAVPRERAPWAFQDASQFYRMRAAPELEALVVQLRANHDVPGQAIAGFLALATDEIRRARPTHLVLDLRTNGGGDLNNTRDFVQRLPSLIPGRIFVLTSPWTFSAAISTAGYLEQAGQDRVTIVGEPVGGWRGSRTPAQRCRSPPNGMTIATRAVATPIATAPSSGTRSASVRLRRTSRRPSPSRRCSRDVTPRWTPLPRHSAGGEPFASVPARDDGAAVIREQP